MVHELGLEDVHHGLREEHAHRGHLQREGRGQPVVVVAVVGGEGHLQCPRRRVKPSQFAEQSHVAVEGGSCGRQVRGLHVVRHVVAGGVGGEVGPLDASAAQDPFALVGCQEFPRHQRRGPSVHASEVDPLRFHGLEVLSVGRIRIVGWGCAGLARKWQAPRVLALLCCARLDTLHAQPHPAWQVVVIAQVGVPGEHLVPEPVLQPRPDPVQGSDLVEAREGRARHSVGVRGRDCREHSLGADVLDVLRPDGEEHEDRGHRESEEEADAGQLQARQVPALVLVALEHELLEAGDIVQLLNEVGALRRRRRLAVLPARLLVLDLALEPHLGPDGLQLLLRGPDSRGRLVHQHEVRVLVGLEAVLDGDVVLHLRVRRHGLQDVVDLRDAPVEASVLPQLLGGHVPIHAVGQVVGLVCTRATAPSHEDRVYVGHLPLLLLRRLTHHELHLVEDAHAEVVAGRPLGGLLFELLLHEAADLVLTGGSRRLFNAVRRGGLRVALAHLHERTVLLLQRHDLLVPRGKLAVQRLELDLHPLDGFLTPLPLRQQLGLLLLACGDVHDLQVLL
mmetsp:Transcript_87229/g.270072  ORF Transcript_87229/g.270072 Transcript_87229/m.270072 type:complete len:563 (-) Transcript_87229:63-1751(-)